MKEMSVDTAHETISKMDELVQQRFQKKLKAPMALLCFTDGEEEAFNTFQL